MSPRDAAFLGTDRKRPQWYIKLRHTNTFFASYDSIDLLRYAFQPIITYIAWASSHTLNYQNRNIKLCQRWLIGPRLLDFSTILCQYLILLKFNSPHFKIFFFSYGMITLDRKDLLSFLTCIISNYTLSLTTQSFHFCEWWHNDPKSRNFRLLNYTCLLVTKLGTLKNLSFASYRLLYFKQIITHIALNLSSPISYLTYPHLYRTKSILTYIVLNLSSPISH